MIQILWINLRKIINIIIKIINWKILKNSITRFECESRIQMCRECDKLNIINRKYVTIVCISKQHISRQTLNNPKSDRIIINIESIFKYLNVVSLKYPTVRRIEATIISLTQKIIKNFLTLDNCLYLCSSSSQLSLSRIWICVTLFTESIEWINENFCEIIEH